MEKSTSVRAPKASRHTRQQALWFIQSEKERVLRNVENGTTDRTEAIGSLGTLYQIASLIGESDIMSNVWQTITALRSAVPYPLRLR
ncbi:hypothetical protein MO973_20305 [Paenibacillus sp. TRM 82003]|nr:hypothetical protein [Paenibacillus sp. TRM 82003]